MFKLLGFSNTFLKYQDSLLEEMEKEHGLPAQNNKIVQRVSFQFMGLCEALETIFEAAEKKNILAIHIQGSLVEYQQKYPFDIFMPALAHQLNHLKPGATLTQEGPAKSARFLGKDFTYHSLVIQLPSHQPNANPAVPIEKFMGGGLTTGYLRYVHALVHLAENLPQCPPDANNIRAKLFGPGLMESSDTIVQCPQLIELCAVLPPETQIEVIDNNPALIATLEQVFLKPWQGPKQCLYPTSAPATFFNYNSLVYPSAPYEALMETLGQEIPMLAFRVPSQLSFVEQDIVTAKLEAEAVDVIFNTNCLSNVFKMIDEDAGETKSMLELLTKFVQHLRYGGSLYIDSWVLEEFVARFDSPESIEEIVMPYLSYYTKSELSLTHLPVPVAKNASGTLIRCEERLSQKGYISPVYTQDMHVIKRVVSCPNPPANFLPKLISHLQTGITQQIKKNS